MQILKVEDLSLQYGNQNVLNHVSFSIQKAKIVGLLGPNGAGKSSIIKILAGLVFPNTGKLIFNNIKKKTFADLRESCGYLIDSPAFYPFLSAAQNLNLIKRINKSEHNIQDLLIKVGLENVNQKKVKHFSTGMKQRLAIAQALLRAPELMILDEPFNGLDPNGFQDLIHLLKDLNKKGTTILISSHLLNELEQFADAFLLLHQGNIALDISKEELMNSKRKVAFTFENKPSKELNNFISNLEGIFESSVKVICHLYPNEIASVVNKFVSLGSTPINVETLTILQEKYLEITV